MVVLFLIDTSMAMMGESINVTSQALNHFREEIKKNRYLCEILDIAVVEFNSTVHVVQDFAPLECMKPAFFFPSGSSDLNSGLTFATDMILEKSRLYRKNGIPQNIPWLIVITDDGGSDTPIVETANKIKELEERDAVRLWIMGTKESKIERIRELGLSKRILPLNGHTLTDLFEKGYKGLLFGGEHYEYDEYGNKYFIKKRSVPEKGVSLPIPNAANINDDDWLKKHKILFEHKVL